jgi:homeobox-leucine zipper protein
MVGYQIYAPTTLAAARDFWTLRYSTSLEDGSYVVGIRTWFCSSMILFIRFALYLLFCLQVCERSLTSATGGPNGPLSSSFVRAKMLSSGFLIRPCDGGGSIIHIVDHVDLDVSSVPEVLRPLYESSKILAQKMTVAVSSI